MELHLDEEERNSLLGNIYIGRVHNIVKNIHAAFIEVGDGLQCYYSLSDNKDPIFLKKGSSPKLQAGDELLVQVCRENLKSKPPAVTSNLNLTGNYVVLTTENKSIGFSSKLSKEEKQQLGEWLKPFVSNRFGCIVRTNSREADEATFQAELKLLTSIYEEVTEKAKFRKPLTLLHQNNPTTWLSSLRDTYKAGLTEIITASTGLLPAPSYRPRPFSAGISTPLPEYFSPSRRHCPWSRSKSAPGPCPPRDFPGKRPESRRRP